jgi:hypothetical protein
MTALHGPARWLTTLMRKHFAKRMKKVARWLELSWSSHLPVQRSAM